MIEKRVFFDSNGNPTEIRYYDQDILTARLGIVQDPDGNFIGLRELDPLDVMPLGWVDRFKQLFGNKQRRIDITTIDFIGLINWINTIKTIKTIETIDLISKVNVTVPNRSAMVEVASHQVIKNTTWYNTLISGAGIVKCVLWRCIGNVANSYNDLYPLLEIDGVETMIPNTFYGWYTARCGVDSLPFGFTKYDVSTPIYTFRMLKDTPFRTSWRVGAQNTSLVNDDYIEIYAWHELNP